MKQFTARQSLKQAKRIVIKVGTSSLVHPNGAIKLQHLDKLAFVLTDLRNQGKEIIFVSSGAMAVGLSVLQRKKRPTSIPEQQAVASVGQSELMKLYSRFFRNYHQVVAQVLMTRDVVDFPVSRENVTNTFEQLLTMGIIPIVNENDSVAVEELDHLTKFGDNDKLSGIVAEITKADLLIMLSDIDGFYDKNPHTYSDAKLFQQLHKIDENHYQVAGGNGSKFGTGGMLTKLLAAEHVLAQNSQMVLTNGEDPTDIFRIIDGEDIGTLFTPLRR